MSKSSKQFLSLNDLDNLKIKVRKSDNTRRTVGHVTADIGDGLAECQTPAEIGEHAAKHGLRVEEIMTRANNAPNFGQFRMVIGNRIRGIEQRMENTGMSREDAAYPKEAAKARREARAAERAAAKEKARNIRDAAKAAKKAKTPAKGGAVVKKGKGGRKTAKSGEQMKKEAQREIKDRLEKMDAAEGPATV